MLGTLLLCLLLLLSACVIVPVRYLLGQEWPRLRRALYFPIAGQSRMHHDIQRERLLNRLGGVSVALQTEDGRTVHCVWIESRGSSTANSPRAAADLAGGEGVTAPAAQKPLDEKPVALLLHANAMVLDDMVDWAYFYLCHDVSVLLVTFWGYPDPEEDEVPDPQPTSDSSLLLGSAPDNFRCPTERSMYLDAEAALRYLQQVNVARARHRSSARPPSLARPGAPRPCQSSCHVGACVARPRVSARAWRLRCGVSPPSAPWRTACRLAPRPRPRSACSTRDCA